MNKRGKVLRDPHAGPGLLMIEGRQYQFWLDETWTLNVPPRPGLAVDVTFDQRGQIQRIGAVSPLEIQDVALQSGTTKLRRTLWNAVQRYFQ